MQPEPTVFVVDDDEAVRDSMKWLVETIGVSVRTFGSAQDFLAAYRPEMPGCLVLDVRMPGMSGLDLQDRLQSLGVHLPVIVMTGFGDVSTAVRAMKGGAVDFIEKPFRDQSMLDLIQKCLDRDAEMRHGRGGTDVPAHGARARGHGPGRFRPLQQGDCPKSGDCPENSRGASREGHGKNGRRVIGGTRANGRHSGE